MDIRRLALVSLFILFGATTARADLELYLNSLNFSAQGNFGGYRAALGAHFGAPNAQLDLLFRTVDRPGDAALCLWLSRQSRQPLEVVLDRYRGRKGAGWGALAKDLGIQPGSPAFKALKAGEIGWHPGSAAPSAGRHPGDGRSGPPTGKRKQG